MFTVLPKNPEGRPPAVIDLLTVERAASIGCTVEDIAALLGLSRKTIYNHMEQDPELAEAMDRGRGLGRASLRRMQWEKAEDRRTTSMLKSGLDDNVSCACHARTVRWLRSTGAKVVAPCSQSYLRTLKGGHQPLSIC